eukprot:COSAG01_NODE_7266_length_3276_cov_2.619767_1_plen_32_part_10
MSLGIDSSFIRCNVAPVSTMPLMLAPLAVVLF